jgi:hypothetical protein
MEGWFATWDEASRCGADLQVRLEGVNRCLQCVASLPYVLIRPYSPDAIIQNRDQ